MGLARNLIAETTKQGSSTGSVSRDSSAAELRSIKDLVRLADQVVGSMALTRSQPFSGRPGGSALRFAALSMVVHSERPLLPQRRSGKNDETPAAAGACHMVRSAGLEPTTF